MGADAPYLSVDLNLSLIPYRFKAANATICTGNSLASLKNIADFFPLCNIVFFFLILRVYVTILEKKLGTIFVLPLKGCLELTGSTGS